MSILVFYDFKNFFKNILGDRKLRHQGATMQTEITKFIVESRVIVQNDR